MYVFIDPLLGGGGTGATRKAGNGKRDGSGNGNGNGNGKLKITIPLARAMDGRAVDHWTRAVWTNFPPQSSLETSSVSDKNVSTDRSAWTILIGSQVNIRLQ